MIKKFKHYIKVENIHRLCKKYYLSNYSINDDLTVNVNGSVIITGYDISNIPINFNNVEGSFYCQGNKLTTLVGTPRYVSGDFYCTGNQLTTLDGAPNYVGGDFYCDDNKLISLDGCPNYIGDLLNCNDNKLTSLKNIPTTIKNLFVDKNNLPIEVKTICDKYDGGTILVKHQEDYGIWNTDGSFNKGRFDIFINDYDAGIFK